MSVTVYEVLAHTPPWVFILFAYLMVIGIIRLRPSVRQLGRVWITPMIFVTWVWSACSTDIWSSAS